MNRNAHVRSTYAAVSQLLRSFRDDAALLAHPLIARRFAESDSTNSVAESARALIVSAIDRIVDAAPPNGLDVAKRQRHVLMRHDIEGVTCSAVCAELAITERQMYRDRKAASQLLATHLRSVLSIGTPPRRVPAVSYDAADTALGASLHMNAVGATRSARERIAAVARSSRNVRTRIAALCLLAQQSAEADDASESLRLIGSIEMLLRANGSGIGPWHAARFRAHVDLVRGVALWQENPEQMNLRLMRRGIDEFVSSQAQASGAADLMTQALLRCAMLAAAVFLDAGDLGARLAALGDLQRTVKNLAGLPDYLRLELRALDLKSQILIGCDHEAIAVDMTATMEQAHHLGLSAIASDAAHYCSWIAARNGDKERARIFQANALAFTDAQDAPWQSALVYSGAALVEELIGTPERALELARLGSGFTGKKPSAFNGYVLARAQLQCGLAEAALDSAENVVSSVSSGELARGATLLVMAEAAAMLGRVRAATSHLDEAVAKFKVYGNSYLLADAKSIRARLCLSPA